MPLKIQKDDQTSINLTPMIDIVFLLIIFFMVSSRFGKPENERDIKIQVPSVSNATALTTAPRKRIIDVSQDGQIAIDRKEVTLDELETELAAAQQQYAKIGVVIRGDGKAYHEKITKVLMACARAKILDTRFAVRDSQFR